MSRDAVSSASPVTAYATLLWRLTEGRQWDRALAVAREWLAQDPENTHAHLAAGQALINLRQYAAARSHLEKVASQRPGSGFVHRLLSIVFFQAGDPRRADEHIQQAIALEPGDATHWYHLAWMRFQQQSPKAATEHARRALELRPDDADTLNLLALCEQRDPREQLAGYRRALALDPENSVVHNNLGAYYLDREKDLAQAEACFRRALTIDPTSELAQRNLFRLLRRRDRLYRLLNFPSLLLGRFSLNRGSRSVMARVGILAVWILIGRFLLGLFVCWLCAVYPLVKVYEYLTIGDIKAQAGVLGARRGGWLGFRRWSFRVRFGLFAFLSLLFWGTIYVLFRLEVIPLPALLGVAFLVAVIFLMRMLSRRIDRWRVQRMARRGEKKFRRQMRETAGGR